MDKSLRTFVLTEHQVLKSLTSVDGVAQQLVGLCLTGTVVATKL